jgi:hypothetical protein
VIYWLTPLKVTFDTFPRFSPSMLTVVLTVPKVGEKSVMIGPVPVRKLLLVVKLPLGVVTMMGPVVAPLGTVALIWVVAVIVALAEVLLNLTVIGLKKFSPSMVTVVAAAPAVGVKSVMMGRLPALKLLVLTADPALVVTVRGTLAAPTGTEALTTVVAVTVPLTGVAFPVKVTVVPPTMKFAPKIYTCVGVDEKLVMVGATRKLALLVAVPSLLVPTLKGPLVAPMGTTAVN